MSNNVLLFTDLDGCLLNKSDYSFADAIPTLKRLAAAEIPVVLCSSKTQAEMQPIARELALRPAPMTCENGGLIVWSSTDSEACTILGRDRSEILTVLSLLKSEYSFRSFADLGVDGVMKTTDLPREKAMAASDRQCTEPLLWDDNPATIEVFRARLAEHKLTLTEGGRFWHVAASTTKGTAMRTVAESIQKARAAAGTWTTIAIGDSPIDQSMLDVADVPIGIPQPDGEVKVHVTEQHGMIAETAGAAGWAQSVGIVLDRLGIPS